MLAEDGEVGRNSAGFGGVDGAPPALRGVAERTTAENGALPVGRPPARCTTRHVVGFAEGVQEPFDTLGVGDDGEEPQAALARGALEDVDGEGALERLGPGSVTTAGLSSSLAAAEDSGMARSLGAGATDCRQGLAGARTPAYFTVWKRGGGTLVARRHWSDSGSISTATVPSWYARSRAIRIRPLGRA